MTKTKTADTFRVTWSLERQRQRYDGPVYRRFIDFNPETGLVEVYDRHRDINGTPFSAYHGRIIRLDASGLSRKAIESVLRDSDSRELLSRVVAGYSEEWDGSNRRGRLTADAFDALSTLDSYLATPDVPRQTYYDPFCEECCD